MSLTFSINIRDLSYSVFLFCSCCAVSNRIISANSRTYPWETLLQKQRHLRALLLVHFNSTFKISIFYDLYFYTVAQHKLFCANQLVLHAVLAKIFWYHATVCPLDQQNLVCDFICHLTTLLSMCKVLFIQRVERGASHPAQTNIPHQLFCICCKTLMYTPELGTLQRSLQAAVADVCEQMDAWMGPKLNQYTRGGDSTNYTECYQRRNPANTEGNSNGIHVSSNVRCR